MNDEQKYQGEIKNEIFYKNITTVKVDLNEKNDESLPHLKLNVFDATENSQAPTGKCRVHCHEQPYLTIAAGKELNLNRDILNLKHNVKCQRFNPEVTIEYQQPVRDTMKSEILINRSIESGNFSHDVLKSNLMNAKLSYQLYDQDASRKSSLFGNYAPNGIVTPNINCCDNSAKPSSSKKRYLSNIEEAKINSMTPFNRDYGQAGSIISHHLLDTEVKYLHERFCTESENIKNASDLNTEEVFRQDLPNLCGDKTAHSDLTLARILTQNFSHQKKTFRKSDRDDLKILYNPFNETSSEKCKEKMKSFSCENQRSVSGYLQTFNEKLFLALQSYFQQAVNLEPVSVFDISDIPFEIFESPSFFKSKEAERIYKTVDDRQIMLNEEKKFIRDHILKAIQSLIGNGETFNSISKKRGSDFENIDLVQEFCKDETLVRKQCKYLNTLVKSMHLFKGLKYQKNSLKLLTVPKYKISSMLSAYRWHKNRNRFLNLYDKVKIDFMIKKPMKFLNSKSTREFHGLVIEQIKRKKSEEMDEYIEWTNKCASQGENFEKAGYALPWGFPPTLVHRTLGIYSLIRSLSLCLHLMPFSTCSFLRALSLQMRTPLLDETHSILIRVLYASFFKDEKNSDRWLERKFLDNHTWPVFLLELIERSNDESSNLAENSDSLNTNNDTKTCRAENINSLIKISSAIKISEYHLLPIEYKVELLEFLCNYLLDAEWLQRELEHRESYFDILNLDEDGSGSICSLCNMGGTLICCEHCPRVFHIRCIGGKSGTDVNDWQCFECRSYLMDPSTDGLRISKTTVTETGEYWVIGGYVIKILEVHRNGPSSSACELLTPFEVYQLGKKIGRTQAHEFPFNSINFPQHCFTSNELVSMEADSLIEKKINNAQNIFEDHDDLNSSSSIKISETIPNCIADEVFVNTIESNNMVEPDENDDNTKTNDKIIDKTTLGSVPNNLNSDMGTKFDSENHEKIEISSTKCNLGVPVCSIKEKKNIPFPVDSDVFNPFLYSNRYSKAALYPGMPDIERSQAFPMKPFQRVSCSHIISSDFSIDLTLNPENLEKKYENAHLQGPLNSFNLIVEKLAGYSTIPSLKSNSLDSLIYSAIKMAETTHPLCFKEIWYLPYEVNCVRRTNLDSRQHKESKAVASDISTIAQEDLCKELLQEETNNKDSFASSAENENDMSEFKESEAQINKRVLRSALNSQRQSYNNQSDDPYENSSFQNEKIITVAVEHELNPPTGYFEPSMIQRKRNIESDDDYSYELFFKTAYFGTFFYEPKFQRQLPSSLARKAGRRGTYCSIPTFYYPPSSQDAKIPFYIQWMNKVMSAKTAAEISVHLKAFYSCLKDKFSDTCDISYNIIDSRYVAETSTLEYRIKPLNSESGDHFTEDQWIHMDSINMNSLRNWLKLERDRKIETKFKSKRMRHFDNYRFRSESFDLRKEQLQVSESNAVKEYIREVLALLLKASRKSQSFDDEEFKKRRQKLMDTKSSCFSELLLLKKMHESTLPQWKDIKEEVYSKVLEETRKLDKSIVEHFYKIVEGAYAQVQEFRRRETQEKEEQHARKLKRQQNIERQRELEQQREMRNKEMESKLISEAHREREQELGRKKKCTTADQQNFLLQRTINTVPISTALQMSSRQQYSTPSMNLNSNPSLTSFAAATVQEIYIELSALQLEKEKQSLSFQRAAQAGMVQEQARLKQKLVNIDYRVDYLEKEIRRRTYEANRMNPGSQGFQGGQQWFNASQVQVEWPWQCDLNWRNPYRYAFSQPTGHMSIVSQYPTMDPTTGSRGHVQPPNLNQSMDILDSSILHSYASVENVAQSRHTISRETLPPHPMRMSSFDVLAQIAHYQEREAERIHLVQEESRPQHIPFNRANVHRHELDQIPMTSPLSQSIAQHIGPARQPDHCRSLRSISEFERPDCAALWGQNNPAVRKVDQSIMETLAAQQNEQQRVKEDSAWSTQSRVDDKQRGDERAASSDGFVSPIGPTNSFTRCAVCSSDLNQSSCIQCAVCDAMHHETCGTSLNCRIGELRSCNLCIQSSQVPVAKEQDLALTSQSPARKVAGGECYDGAFVSRSWLQSCRLMNNTYVPQVGDRVWYFAIGHRTFLTTNCDDSFTSVAERKAPVLREMVLPTSGQLCELKAISYEFPKGIKLHCQPVVSAQLRLSPLTGDKERSFSVSYWPTDCADFIVLAEKVTSAENEEWKQGDRINILFSDGMYYGGMIASVKKSTDGSPVWESVEVIWDEGGESSCVNLWELERPAPKGSGKKNSGGSRKSRSERVSDQRLQMKQHFLSAEMQQDIRFELSKFFDENETLSEPFLSPVTDDIAQHYSSEVALPMHLNLILDRLDAAYYRHVQAIVADLKLVVTNCDQYNGPDEIILKQARKLILEAVDIVEKSHELAQRRGSATDGDSKKRRRRRNFD